MRDLSRRGFFKKFGKHAIGHTAFSQKESTMEHKPSEEFLLGRLSEFPPGKQRSFSCRGGALMVVSSEAGLRAEWRMGEVLQSHPLRLLGSGELVADLDRVCNQASVFSLMTGEMAEGE